MQAYVPLATEKDATSVAASPLSMASPDLFGGNAPSVEVLPPWAALLAPLTDRIRMGEGGLLLLNVLLAWKYHPGREAFGLTATSLLCLLSLYVFNDWIDARADLENPKKDRRLAAAYLKDRGWYLMAWMLMTIAAVVLGSWSGTTAITGVLFVVITNIAYSLFFKKIPYLDLGCVCLWGAAYLAISTDSTPWLLLTGAMTAISHIYQASEDRVADQANAILTSATIPLARLTAILSTLTSLLAMSTWMLSPGILAFSFAAFPFYWWTWHARPRFGWLLSKAHFGAVVTCLLLGSA